MRAKFVTATIIATAFSVAGCTPPSFPVNYAPSSTLTASGTVEVADFEYVPATKHEVDPNQLKNTALGSIKVDQNVSELYRNAVFTELRFVGIKVTGGNKKLSGKINEFLVDDLGGSVDWTLDVDYVVTDATTGTAVYRSEKGTKKTHQMKSAGAFPVSLNQVIRENIEALIQDPDFIKAIN